MKLILSLPALVIVLDCRALESFKFLKKFQLREVKQLVVLFCFNVLLGFLWSLYRAYGDLGIFHSILKIVYSATIFLINLTITVTAVRFVASLDLVYDNYLSVSRSEDLPEEPFNSSAED